MIGNIERFVEGIKIKGINKKGSIYAQIIKGERLSKHKTLEEVADGICSVSYLCKMENDVLTPPINFMKTLFEKMELDYDTISNENFEESVSKALEYFYKESDELNELHKSLVKYDKSPSIKLVNCLYYLKNKQYTLLFEALTYLNSIKDTLGGLEALVLIYVVLKYYIDVYNFEKAIVYLKTLDYFDVETKWLKFLLIEANLITSLHMKLINRFSNYYCLLDTLAYNGYSFEKRIVAKIMYNILKCDEYKNEVIESINEYKGLIYNKECLYYYFILCLKLNIDVSDLLLSKEMMNIEQFVSLYAYKILLEYKDKGFIEKDLENNLNTLYTKCEERKDNIIHLLFIKFVLLIIDHADDLKILQFLRKEYVPIVNKYFHVLFDDVLKKAYLHLLGKNSQYKEAYIFLLNNLNIDFNH